jgi:hypothetical protein
MHGSWSSSLAALIFGVLFVALSDRRLALEQEVIEIAALLHFKSGLAWSAEGFDHAGAPVAGHRVSLTASSSLSRDHALSGRQDS